MYKILIVEDDNTISGQIGKYLARWGYETACVEDFENILSQFTAFDPQLVLLDIGLPFYNGYYWCGEIRKISQVPVVFVSSASDNMNIVMAMNMGGDDFVAKPFDIGVLTAKIQALLRRTYDYKENLSVLEHRGAFLNVESGVLTYRGKAIDLTKNEHRILALLMKGKGQIISRERLMDALWEMDCYVDDNALTVNVGRLRKKLEANGLADFVMTKFGEGYYIADENAADRG